MKVHSGGAQWRFTVEFQATEPTPKSLRTGVYVQTEFYKHRNLRPGAYAQDPMSRRLRPSFRQGSYVQEQDHAQSETMPVTLSLRPGHGVNAQDTKSWRKTTPRSKERDKKSPEGKVPKGGPRGNYLRQATSFLRSFLHLLSN